MYLKNRIDTGCIAPCFLVWRISVRPFTHSDKYCPKQTLYLLFGFYLLLSTHFVWAEEQTSETTQKYGQNYYLEEVLVTARKKSESENVQDVPISVSVYSGDTIEANFARDLTDIGDLAPNVNLYDIGTFPNTANFYVRGMGIVSSIPSDEPGRKKHFFPSSQSRSF